MSAVRTQQSPAHFQIIVAEDYRKSTPNKQNLPKWQDVQQFRSWPPYQVRMT